MDPYISKSGRYLAHDIVCDYGVFIKTSSTIKSEDAIEFTDVKGKWKLITCLGQSSNAKVIVDVLEDDYNVTHGIVDTDNKLDKVETKEPKFRICCNMANIVTGGLEKEIIFSGLTKIDAESKIKILWRQDPLTRHWIEEDT